MKKENIHALTLVSILLVASLGAFAYAANLFPGPKDDPGPQTAVSDGFLSINAELDRSKVALGSDGRVSMSLTLTARAGGGTAIRPKAPATAMVVVLDKSGSMQGQKLADAKQAIMDLLTRLSEQDRFGLVTYSSGVSRYCGLTPVTPGFRQQMAARIMSIPASGNTNLSGGLEEGIRLMEQTGISDMPRRVLLISDGLANRGIVDPDPLSQIAAFAAERGIGVSTIGVGLEFNEILMARIADFGSGRYHYLAEPGQFASIFVDEFQKTRSVAASNIRVTIPLKNGISLMEASGYPVTMKNGVASFSPGDLAFGQSRRIFLTFSVPSHKTGTHEIPGPEITWNKDGGIWRQNLSQNFLIACVPDEQEARASLAPAVWEEKVVQDEYNKLKEQVSDDIRGGKKEGALSKIQNYLFRYRKANESVGSAKVADNLDKDVKELEAAVEEAFNALPPQAAQQRKKSAKAIQFDAYKNRRQTN